MTMALEGRKLLRIEARNALVPIERKPEWIKTRANMGPEYTRLRSLVKSEGLHTVCQDCLLYTSPSPRDATLSRMPSSA